MARAGKRSNVLKLGVSGSSSLPKARLIEIPYTLSVKQLADLLQVSGIDVIKQLMRNGIRSLKAILVLKFIGRCRIILLRLGRFGILRLFRRGRVFLGRFV